MRKLQTTLVVVRDMETDEHFAISNIGTTDHGQPETMAYACNPVGEVVDYTDVAGGIGWSIDNVISEMTAGCERTIEERISEWQLAMP